MDHKIQVGDKVLVEFTINKLPYGVDKIYGATSPGGRPTYIGAEIIEAGKHIPAPYVPKVGEKFTWGSGDTAYSCVMVDDTHIMYQEPYRIALHCAYLIELKDLRRVGP